MTFDREPTVVGTVDTEYRTIRTAIPAPGTRDLLERLERCEARSMQGQLPLVWDRAEDFSIYDAAGNRWIDFTSAAFLTNVGHANQRVVAAVRDAIDQPLIHSYVYANEIRVRYPERLIEWAGAPFTKSYLVSTGAETTEAAFKLMRMEGHRRGKRRLGVLCLEGNFHGRTTGSQMMSGSASAREWLGFMDPDIHHLPFPYPWALEGQDPAAFFEDGLRSLVDRGLDPSVDLCGVMLETFQGWGAVFYPDEYVQAVEAFCREAGVVLAFDEMQAGFGRTGRDFGFQHYGVEPDLICCGKGMSGGLPLSGVLGRSELLDVAPVGSMSSTHSANPLACAAALAVLEEMVEQDLTAESSRRGELMHRLLAEIREAHPDRVSMVLGRGLLAAVIMRDPVTGLPDGPMASRVAVRCMEKGVFVVHTGRESIKISPPLTIADDALLEAVTVLEEAITEVSAEDDR